MVSKKQRFKKTKVESKMRVSQKDLKEYNKLNKSVKAKIARTKKNYGIDLRGEVMTDLPLEMFTRKMFNVWKEKASSFTNRANQNYQFVKNEHGVTATKKEVNELKKEIKKAQKVAKEKIKKIEKNIPSVKERNVFMKEPTHGIYVPKDLNFGQFRSRRDFEKRVQTMQEKANPKYYDERTRKMQENYIKSLEETFNSDSDELVGMIREMSSDEFYDLYLREGEMQFRLFYVGEYTGQDPTDTIEELMSYVERYKRGDYNDGLKNFPNTW